MQTPKGCTMASKTFHSLDEVKPVKTILLLVGLVLMETYEDDNIELTYNLKILKVHIRESEIDYYLKKTHRSIIQSLPKHTCYVKDSFRFMGYFAFSHIDEGNDAFKMIKSNLLKKKYFTFGNKSYFNIYSFDFCVKKLMSNYTCNYAINTTVSDVVSTWKTSTFKEFAPYHSIYKKRYNHFIENKRSSKREREDDDEVTENLAKRM